MPANSKTSDPIVAGTRKGQRDSQTSAIFPVARSCTPPRIQSFRDAVEPDFIGPCAEQARSGKRGASSFWSGRS